jgi:hypothetical protein
MPVLSIDFETHLARRAEHAPRIVCGGWSLDGAAAELGLRDDALAVLIAALRDPKITILNQYLAYDLACALEEFETHPEKYPRLRGRFGSASEAAILVWDALRAGRCVGVDVCQQLLDVARGEGLIVHREKLGYNLPNIATWNGIPTESKDEHEWRTYYSQLDGIDPRLWPADAAAYVKDDADKPHKILSNQLKENQRWIDSYGYPVLHQAPSNTWTQMCLQLVAAHGVRVSPERAHVLKATVDAEIAGYARRLRHEDTCTRADRKPNDKDPGKCPGCLLPFGADTRWNQARAQGLIPAAFENAAPLIRWKKEKGQWRLSRDTKAAAARMTAICAAKGRPVTMTETSDKYPAGQVKLDEDCCVLSEDKILIAYADYVGADVLRSRCNDLLQGAEGWPLHTSFTTVRATGRTSSRKPKDPHYGTQQQNWPRVEGARESLEPRQFYWDPSINEWVPACFLWGDFEAAEMHTLAQNCKDEVGYSKLGDLLNAGVDPHAFFAGVARLRMTGDPLEIANAVLAREDSKDQRGWAKPYNFGKPGGMGDEKFILFSRKQYGVEFTREEAAYYARLWFGVLPEVKELHGVVKRLLGRHETCTVRIRRGGFIGGGKRFTAACNFFFQAPCAAGAKAALNRVMYECYADVNSPLFGFRVWNLVHDELCLEGPRWRVHPAAVRLREIMEEEFNVFTPDYPTGVETIAGMNWSKGAKPLFHATARDDAGGKVLIPGLWLPKEQRTNPKKSWVPFEEERLAA